MYNIVFIKLNTKFSNRDCLSYQNPRQTSLNCLFLQLQVRIKGHLFTGVSTIGWNNNPISRLASLWKVVLEKFSPLE